MRSTAIFGGFALVLLALLYVLWGRTPGPAAATTPEEARSSLEGPRASLEDVVPTAADGASQARPPGVAQRAPLSQTAGPGPTCRIRVVDAASQAPLPDAHVWIQREDVDVESPAWWWPMRRFNDVEPVLRSGLGDALALDHRAEAFVPRPTRARIVAAARNQLHGEATVEPGEAECVVELKSYHALAIEVVDRSERPVAGALVALYWGEFDPLDGRSTWVADAAGRVWFPKLESHFWSEEYRGPVRVSLAAGVAGEPEVVLFTPETTPADPVRLVAGDFGRLVLQLVDPHGRELALDGRAYIDLFDEVLEDPPLALRAGADIDAQLSSGRALFASVGLGMTFSVMIAVEDHEAVWREVPGPTESGQELLVLVPIGERCVRVRGRVQGIGACYGELAAHRTWLTGHHAEDHASFSGRAREGETFDRPSERASHGRDLGGPWILELFARGKAGVSTTVVATFDQQTGVVDLGDVRFEPVPELARVRVLDPTGAPAEWAVVEIKSSTDDRHAGTDETGIALLAGLASQLPLRVRATHGEWLASDWTRIDAPGSEATLSLRRGATLEGSALLPRGGELHDFGLALSIDPSAPDVAGTTLAGELVEGGRFRFGPCEPGRAGLVVRWQEHVVAERHGIELVGGETTRLAPLDLAAGLHPLALTFELASGEPWSGGHLEVRDPDGQLSSWTTIGAAARAVLLAQRPSVDLWVAACGARVAFFEGVLDGDRLTLQPAPSVRLHLSAGIGRPDPPLELLVRGGLQSSETFEFETYDGLDFQAAVVGANGTAWLRMPRPGLHELEWFVRHAGTGAEFEIQQAETQTVELTETTTVPSVEVRLELEEVERALRQAGG